MDAGVVGEPMLFCDMVTSTVVVEELSAAQSSFVPQRLSLLQPLPMLTTEPEIDAIVQAYAEHKVMPVRPGGDALHLALASSAGCDLIVTWNCRHLANPNKFAHMRHVNGLLGLPTPEIVTPMELLRKER